MTSRTLKIAFLLLAAPGLVLAATTYKWVDAEGNTHYTQSPPPPGTQGQELKPPPKVDTETAQKEAQELEQSLSATGEKRATATKTAKEEAEFQAQKKQKCEQAKQRLEKAQRPLTNFVDPDGTQRRATEEERQQQIQGAEAQVKEFCG